MDTNCAPLIADLFLFCYDMGFMSNLHKQYDLIDKFNDSSRYLDENMFWKESLTRSSTVS